MKLPENPDDLRLSLGDHLDELRSRLIRSLFWTALAFFVCFYFSEDLMSLILHPVLVTLDELGLSRFVIHTSVQEKFISYLKVSAVSAVLVSSPMIAYHLWQFIGAGLYPHERRLVYVFIPFSVINFLTGVGFFYFIVMPWGLRFLLGFGAEASGYQAIQPFIKISELLGFFVTLSLVFGAVFEMPLVMLILSRLEIFTPEDYASKRKLAILTAFVLGAMLTPPDIFTQIILAIPLIGLYEIGILISKFGAVQFEGTTRVRLDWRGVGLIILPTLLVAAMVTARIVAFGQRAPTTSEPIRLFGGAAADLLRDLGKDASEESVLASSNARVRYQAVRFRIQAGERPEALRSLLLDPDPGVRIRVASYLAEAGEQEGFDQLLDDLAGDDALASYLAGQTLHLLCPSVEAPSYGDSAAERSRAASGWREWWDRRE